MVALFCLYDMIGIFDSGIGGLTVAKEIRQLLLSQPLLYIADNARAPYGGREAEEILSFSQAITHRLVTAGASLIVIACNTATSVAIDQLRLEYPQLPFVGMEPAVKPAAEQTINGRIGVMATQLTLRSERYHALLDRFAQEAQVYSDPCLGLVPMIEAGDYQSPALLSRLEAILQPMLAAGVDTVALGCTHYPLITQQIEAICGPRVKIINPAPAAARQVYRLLPETEKPTSPPTYPPLDRFYSSGSPLPLEKALQKLAFRTRLLAPMAYFPSART